MSERPDWWSDRLGELALEARCYCGAGALGTYAALRSAGWRWLVSWKGWACPTCAPQRRASERLADYGGGAD